MAAHASRTIYVGNLPLDVKEYELEDLFYKYGRIVDIELKLPQRPPGYSFVEFEDPRDAQDAIRGRDGYNFNGCLLRVELAHGGRGRSPMGRRRGGGVRGGGRGDGSGGQYGVSRRSEYRVIVRGLPPSASWQDLKDHMRKAGDVCFAQVCRDGEGMMGIVDYTNYEDMQYAIRKLDDTVFRNPWTSSQIQLEAYKGSPPRNRSRSVSRSPIRDRSRSIERDQRPAPRSKSAFHAGPTRPFAAKV